jgi:hypothetical protein
MRRRDFLGSINRVICFFDACRVDNSVRNIQFRRHEFSTGGRKNPDRQFFLGYAVPEGMAAGQPVGEPGFFSQNVLLALENTPEDLWPPNLQTVADSVLRASEQLSCRPQFTVWDEAVRFDAPTVRPSVRDKAVSQHVDTAVNELLQCCGSDDVDSDARRQLRDRITTAWEDDRIRELYREIRAGSGGNSASLRQALNEIVPSRWLDWDEFWKLKMIVRDIAGSPPSESPPLGYLRQLARAVPHGPEYEPNREPDLLSEILHIDLYSGPEQLVTFVEYLAAWAEDGMPGNADSHTAGSHTELRQWNEGVTRRRSQYLDQTRRRARNRAAEARRSGRLDPSMLISIKRSKIMPDRYLVGAWLWPGTDSLSPGRGLPTAVPNTDTLESLRELPANDVQSWLDGLLNGEVAKRLGLGRLPRLRLEFFVSPDLVCSGVADTNWWPWNSRSPLFAQYSLLLRSLVRNDRVSDRSTSMAKWNKLVATRRARPPAVRYTSPAAVSFSGMPSEDLCVILTDELPVDSFRSFHEGLLGSGAPTAFWPTSAGIVELFQRDAETLVGTASLAGLPRRLRRRQQKDPDWGAVVLLWDDPERSAPVGRPPDRMLR